MATLADDIEDDSVESCIVVGTAEVARPRKAPAAKVSCLEIHPRVFHEIITAAHSSLRKHLQPR
jgi:hypothetical protein